MTITISFRPTLRSSYQSVYDSKSYIQHILHIIHAAYIGWAKKQGHCVCPHLQNAWTNLKVFWHTTASLFLNTSIKSIRQSGTNPRHLATKLTPGFSVTKWSEVTRVHCPCLLNNSKICIIWHTSMPYCSEHVCCPYFHQLFYTKWRHLLKDNNSFFA